MFKINQTSVTHILTRKRKKEVLMATTITPLNDIMNKCGYLLFGDYNYLTHIVIY